MKDRLYWAGKLSHVKSLLVAARRSGNDELAKVLSQRLMYFRKRLRTFPKCDVCDTTIATGNRCRMHHKRRLMMKQSRLLKAVLILALCGGGIFLVRPQSIRVDSGPTCLPPLPNRLPIYIPPPPHGLALLMNFERTVFCPQCRVWVNAKPMACVWSESLWELSFLCPVCTNILMVPVPKDTAQ